MDALLAHTATDARSSAARRLVPRSALFGVLSAGGPAGVLLVCLGAYDEPSTEIRRKFTELTGVGTDPIGLTWGEHEVLDVHMGSLGARLRLLPPIPQEDEETLGEFLDAIEEGRWSWTWNASDEARRDAVRELRPWVEERFGPLDRVDRTELETVWRAYDLPDDG